MIGSDLLAEWVAAQRAMEPVDRRDLMSLGLEAMDALLLVGKVHARRDGELYVPHTGGWPAFVTPILVEYPDTPEAHIPAQAVRFGDIVDLVIWDQRHPHSWALRRGAAEWLGTVELQYCEPPAVPIHRGVLGWLQSGCRGLVLLSREPIDQYRVLSRLHCVEAEDAGHQAELQHIISRPWPGPTVTIARQREACRAA